MTITYTNDKSLYLNITNRCTNRCEFCVRNDGDTVFTSGSLWLEREPSKEEILEDIKKHDLSTFDEMVFCGYGEPTERIDEIIWVSSEVKKLSDITIRLNTNGHANLIHKRDITPMLQDIIDVISISLNAVNAVDYVDLCHPDFGEEGYYGMLEFARLAAKYVSDTRLSAVKGSIPDDDLVICQRIADEIGVKLLIREMW
jgi:radical SAM protein, TatD family-associated